jgi:hypothetical protein
MGDQFVEPGMKQGLAAGQRYENGSHIGQQVQPAAQNVEIDRIGNKVVFIAIAAIEIAAARNHNLHQTRAGAVSKSGKDTKDRTGQRLCLPLAGLNPSFNPCGDNALHQPIA